MSSANYCATSWRDSTIIAPVTAYHQRSCVETYSKFSRAATMVHGHGGGWAGATMAPEGKDHIKGQACLGCKRNSLLLEPQVLHCPHCQGTDIIRHGTTRQGNQRYRCPRWNARCLTCVP